MLKAAITGVGAYLPDYVLTNKELETMVETNDEWIRTRTGIEERRILKGEGLGTSYMGVRAVQDLMEKTNTKPEEVSLLICATVTPDMPFPDTANIIAHEVGMKNAFTYDLSAACSGFLFALNTGAKFIESGTYDKVVIVGADKMSSIIDYRDRSTCIIFGDGAGAVLLEPSKNDFGIQDAILRSNAEGKEFLHIKAGGSAKPTTAATVAANEHFVYQNGRPVFKAAVSGMSKVVKQVMAQNELTTEDIDWLVPHQANIRIIESVARMADFPLDRVIINIQKYGNTTAATLPLCLYDWEDRLKLGDKLILTAFGGGYTWGATYLTWAY
ncbi:MAG: beta-ketoacyl-ACP synthase III [Bacteroidota bacterium]